MKMTATYKKIYISFMWVLPSAIEIIIGSLVGLISILVINQDRFRDALFLPANFSLGTAILESVNNLVVWVAGKAAGTLATAVFWGLIGCLFYILIWLIAGFLAELESDIAIVKYIHPPRTDTSDALKGLVFKTIFRAALILVVPFGISAAIHVFLPLAINKFQTGLPLWPHFSGIKLLLGGLLIELAVLHVFIMMVRLVFLRRRLFSDSILFSYEYEH